MLEAKMISTGRLSKDESIGEDIRAAFAAVREIDAKYGFAAGYYDRTHSDNVKLGKRWANLRRLIAAAGKDEMQVLPRLGMEE